MADNSAIEWTDATWNPIRGCTRVSPGCGGPGPHGGCYAEAVAARFSQPAKGDRPAQPYHGLAEMRGGKPRWTGKVAFVEEALTLPLRWRRPRRIFVNSMSDLFHEKVEEDWIDRIFAVMALCPRHTFQVLTKRADRMRAYLEPQMRGAHGRVITIAHAMSARYQTAGMAPIWPLPNVWLGVSVEDQRRADERIPDLLATPAAVRWISAEPLLGPVDLQNIRPQDRAELDALRGMNFDQGLPCARLDWIVVGGESGPGARPMHPDWARSLRDQCAAAGVPYLFKQWGAYQHGSTLGARASLDRIVFNDGMVLTDCSPTACKAEERERGWHQRKPEAMALVGKKAAGRLLDGVEHNGSPETAR